jgi:type IV fimbrial biogenesis protein FimT
MIELLVTLAVAAVLMGLAMPAFSSFVQNSRLATEANTLVYDLNVARSEAVKFDVPVELCASNDGATCSGGGWNTGWIVLCPANCPPGLGVAPVKLLGAAPLNNSNTVTEEIAGASAVTFLSAGQTAGGKLQFVFCDSRGAAFGRDVEVNSIGEINSASNPGQSVSGTALGGC